MVAQPAVDTAAAQNAAAQADAYLATPLRLRFRGHEIDLSPALMATMLTVNTGADADASPLTFDNPRGLATLLPICSPSSNGGDHATAVLKGRQVVIEPSKEGFGLDMPRLLSEWTTSRGSRGCAKSSCRSPCSSRP